MLYFLISPLIVALLVAIPPTITPDQKLTPAEIVTKHLDSIGPADARARMQGTRVKGECLLTVREGGNGQAQGQIIVSSKGDMNSLKLVFETGTPIWAQFDGSKSSASQFRPGRRTSLEKFFADNEVLFKEGLFGGTLSEAWPFFKIETKNPKLEYLGLKEIAGKKLHTLRYTPRKSSDLKVILYFDPDTFRHVRTEYSQTVYATDQQRIPGGGGGMPGPSSQRASSTRITAFEEFADFKEEHGLILPHTYTFNLSIQSEVKPALIDWSVKLTEFTFNTPFELS